MSKPQALNLRPGMSTTSYNTNCMPESSGTERLKTCITQLWKEGNRKHLRYDKGQLRSHCSTWRHVWVAFEAMSQDKPGVFRISSIYCISWGIWLQPATSHQAEELHLPLRLYGLDIHIDHSAISSLPRPLGIFSRAIIIRESLMSVVSSCVSKFSFLWVRKPSCRHCPDFKVAPGYLHAFICLTQISALDYEFQGHLLPLLSQVTNAWRPFASHSALTCVQGNLHRRVLRMCCKRRERCAIKTKEQGKKAEFRRTLQQIWHPVKQISNQNNQINKQNKNQPKTTTIRKNQPNETGKNVSYSPGV